MKKIILYFTFLFSILTYGQTATEYFEKGKLKKEKKDYEGAIKEFNRAIEMDAEFADSYYHRAAVLVETKKFEEALIDLNQAILLNPNSTPALILRGNTNIKTDRKEKACEDFIKAKQLGDASADTYLQQYFCEYKPQKGENVVLDFPEKENWQITYQDHEDGKNIFLLGRANETSENWTEQAGMCAIIGVQDVDLVAEMNQIYQEELKISPKAKFTFIEKDVTAKYPWIMFTIEAQNNKECDCSESQFYYFIQGKKSFYSCFRSVRGESFSKEKLDNLKQFFLKTEIVNE